MIHKAVLLKKGSSTHKAYFYCGDHFPGKTNLYKKISVFVSYCVLYTFAPQKPIYLSFKIKHAVTIMYIKRKLIPIIFTLSCSLIILQPASAQDKLKDWPPKKFPHDIKNCFHLLSNTYQCKWIFWGIRGIREGTVVAYDTVPAKTGPDCAAVAIVTFGNDTVRVLFTNTANHKPGDRLKVTQAQQPDNDLRVPFDRDFFISEENKSEKPQCRINEYDSRIYKTTWGKIVSPAMPTPKKGGGNTKSAHR